MWVSERRGRSPEQAAAASRPGATQRWFSHCTFPGPPPGPAARRKLTTATGAHLPAAGEATETPACDQSHSAQHPNQALAFLTPRGWEGSPAAALPLRGCELEQVCRWHRGDRRWHRHLLAAGVPVPLENHEAHTAARHPAEDTLAGERGRTLPSCTAAPKPCRSAGEPPAAPRAHGRGSAPCRRSPTSSEPRTRSASRRGALGTVGCSQAAIETTHFLIFPPRTFPFSSTLF